MAEKTLGDYTLVKKIGQGALGTVYLAEQRFMKKPYVLKVLPEDLAADRQFIQRFTEEVEKLSKLEHPHIVKVHNVSSHQGSYFLVTDCVVDEINETTNLAQFFGARKERVDEQEILSILRQIADALDYAHGKTGALVHRGIKLNNVLLGKNNEVYLSDFGLSKIVGTGAMLSRTYVALAMALDLQDAGVKTIQGEESYEGVDQIKLSRLHNTFLQSYVFLSPEQKWGKEVDAKSDVYAFGILAYYMLTRRFPEGTFAMPSEIAPDYHLNWDALIRQTLRQDPDQRPLYLLDALDDVEELTYAREPLTVAKAQPVKIKTMPAPKPLPRSKAEPLAFRTVTPDRVEQKLAEKISAASPVKVSVGGGGRVPPSPYPARNEPVVSTYQPEKQKTEHIEPIPTEMVAVEGGTFWRGSNDGSRDEMPAHQIHLDSFAMDIHPVTNEQFALFLEYVGEEKDNNNHDLILFKESRIHRSSGKVIIESGYAKHPVVGVTWYGAIACAQWIGKRLPTEAEWEIAAKGGVENVLYPTGAIIEKSQANFFSSDTTPVLSYPANPYGLFDMAGNVYEWCQDWYSYNAYDTSVHEPNNPTGPIQGVYRVMRGGCWKSLQEDLRCAHRHRNNPGTVNGTYGFRCAADG